MTAFTLNGKQVSVSAEPGTPLLWVIRDHLKMKGTKYGCGAGMCGACTVHIGGDARFSCQTAIEEVEGLGVTTIEGLNPEGKHPLQLAWIEEQVAQCGYCQSGQIMRAAELLAENANPSREDIVEHMSQNLCRCGTYPRMIRAIERVVKEG